MQYQKQLHLHEARGLVLHELIDPHVAAQWVGYDNSAQFNREYRRLFGMLALSGRAPARSGHFRGGGMKKQASGTYAPRNIDGLRPVREWQLLEREPISAPGAEPPILCGPNPFSTRQTATVTSA